MAESESPGRVYKPIFIEEAFFLSHLPTTTVLRYEFSVSVSFQVSYIRFAIVRNDVCKSICWVSLVYLPWSSPWLLPPSGEARLIAIDTSCSNLSWNTTDDTLRQVSVILGCSSVLRLASCLIAYVPNYRHLPTLDRS